MNRKALQVFLTTFYMSLCATIFAQGLPCNDLLNISADAGTCTVVLTPEIMMEGSATAGMVIAIKDVDQLNGAVTGDSTASVTINTSLIPGFRDAGMAMLTVSVVESATGNSCWGDVMLEYKLPAILTPVADITVSCLADVYSVNPDNATGVVIGHPTLGVTGGLPGIDAASCVNAVITFADEVTPSPCGLDALAISSINRIFTATTAKGAISRDTQLITVDAIEDDLNAPYSPIVVDCEDYEGESGAGHRPTPQEISDLAATGEWGGTTEPDTFGYPFVIDNNIVYELKPGDAVCNVVSTYDDGSYIKACAACAEGQGTVKFVRTWTVLNWCTGEVTYYTQAIKKIDDEGPSITPTHVTEAYTSAWACGDDVALTATVDDDCDENAHVLDIIADFAEVGSGDAPYIDAYNVAHNLPVGTSYFTWIATDCCGNTTSATSYVTIYDETPPVAIAKQNLVVSLTNSGIDPSHPYYSPGAAKLYAVDVNNNSYDNCTAVHLEIRREHDAPMCYNLGDLWNHDNNLSTPDVPWNNNITYDNYSGYLRYGDVEIVEKDATATEDGHLGLDLEDSQYDTDGGEYVKFCCEDAGSEHKVWLRVWDESGNYNETWAYVKVEDKNVPELDPEDAWLYCDDDIDWIYSPDVWTSVSSDEEYYAYHEYNSGIPIPEIENTLCGNYILEYKDTQKDLNSCNVGHWLREWRLLNPDSTLAMDRSWNPIETEQWVFAHYRWGDIHFHWDKVEGEVRNDYYSYPNGQSYNDDHGYDDGIGVYYHHFPADIYPWEDCELTEDDVIKPTVEGLECDVLGRKITIEEYEVGQGQGCKKWYVSYDYINWCVDCSYFTPNGPYGPFGGIVNGQQSTADQATEEGIGYYFGAPYRPFEGCGFDQNGFDGLYHVARFNTVYKFEDNEGPAVTGADANGAIDATCQATVTLAPSAMDNIECNLDLRWTVTITSYGHDDIVLYGEGANPTFDVNGLWPGDYDVYYDVLDACDNLGKAEGTIWIDGKAPTPYCISLHSAVMVDGSVTLWANDFDKGSFTNCPQDDYLYYTFNSKDGDPEHPMPKAADYGIVHYFHGLGETFQDIFDANGNVIYNYLNDAAGKAAFEAGEAQLWLGGNTSGRYFSCEIDDISAPIPVEMRVWDLNFFWNPKVDRVFYSDYCSVSLSLIDNQGACGDSAGGNVMGTVKTVSGEGVDGVQAQLSAELPEYPLFATTTNGTYSFTNLPKGVEYEVTASKVDAFDNGASTLDLVIIQRHILGMAKLDSEYKMIAADINNDEDIKVSDLVELRKVVLGVNNEFTNSSWRFVVADQNFADANHPFPFAEVAGVYANEQANFVAVKIGDVNGDAAVNATSEVVKPRNANTITFVAADKAVEAGQLIDFAVTAENFNEVFGYQFTAALNGLTVENIKSGAIDVATENIATPNASALTMSWTKADGATVSADEVLFTLSLRAEVAGQLSSMINMNSSVTTAEAYTGATLEVANAELEVRGEVASEFVLYQNEPNPFKASTMINFSLPTAANTSVKVYDVTGKVLMTKNVAAAKGLNTLEVTSAQLNGATGVLYYQVESGEFTATKKMIILE